MKRLIVSDKAKADFVEIWNFIAAKSPDAADRLLDEITSKFAMLVSMPQAGRRRDEIAEDVRSFPVGKYVIIYCLTTDNLIILRVLHAARDINSIFGEES